MEHDIGNGFPRDGIDFLRELRENNNKAWFEANRERFSESVQEPARALVRALGKRLEAAYPPTAYDDRKSGGSLMRIHRDVRFSRDKSPYKTNMAMMFAPKGGKRMEAPGFGLQITPEDAGFIAGMFSFPDDLLDRFREALEEGQRRAELESIVTDIIGKLDDDGGYGAYRLGEPDLKRLPRGYPADHQAARWLRYKGLVMYAPEMSIDVLCSPGFIESCMVRFDRMAPLWKWLMGLGSIYAG
jgi:uncharacterized protein (TIGR02453 family)